MNRSTSLDYVKQLDKEGKIKRNLTHGILKDTVAVPGGGYTVIRFVANNPGMAIKTPQEQRRCNHKMCIA